MDVRREFMAFKGTIFSAVALATAISGCFTFASQAQNEGPQPTTALINVSSKNDVPLDPASLLLQINGRATPITSIKPVGPGLAQVVILIDDGLRTNFALQLEDMSKFILALPPSTPVMIGYMENGTVVSPTRGFTTDHREAVGALRIPFSSPGISASPYFCLQELVKNWPTNRPGPRFVLFITNGVDPYNGSTSPLNQDSPYVQNAQEDAQRNGVAVYSLYYSEAGYRGGRGNYSGQSYLTQLSQATGGESLYQLDGSPVSLEPFLKEFTKDMAESYTISFMTDPGRSKPGTLQRVKLKSSQPGVKVHAPDGVVAGVSLQSER
jgi:hypothetical protein